LKKSFILSILFLFFWASSYAQILADASAKALISEGLAYSYNFEFEKAKTIYAKIEQKYPQNPAYHTLMHMMLYQQYAPVAQNTKVKAQYLFHLNKAVELSEKFIKKNENDPEAMFFMLSALGSLTAWQADTGETMKGVNTARKVYPYMKKGLKLTEKQPEFLFTSGLYNYYIEQYPEDHPIVKPFMVFFSGGNKVLGMQQLEACYHKALFSYAESGYYYAYLQLKHENRPERALKMLSPLLSRFPNNLIFQVRYIECLLALGKYNEAQPLLEKLRQFSIGNFYPVAVAVFDGILKEKHEKNDAFAEQVYHRAIKFAPDPRYTQDYQAIAHLGLGRIALRQKKPDIAKKHLNIAENLAEYTATKAEAKRLLKAL
jgi:tetratricopeptide (TPR) repeat protein